MYKTNFSSILTEMIWPSFFAGLGFALAGVLISSTLLGFCLRSAASKGILSKTMAEAASMLLFIPSVAAIFAIITAIGFARENGHADEYFMAGISALVTFGMALYFYMNRKILADSSE